MKTTINRDWIKIQLRRKCISCICDQLGCDVFGCDVFGIAPFSYNPNNFFYDLMDFYFARLTDQQWSPTNISDLKDALQQAFRLIMLTLLSSPSTVKLIALSASVHGSNFKLKFSDSEWYDKCDNLHMLYIVQVWVYPYADLSSFPTLDNALEFSLRTFFLI